jgi:riboflavin synthase
LTVALAYCFPKFTVVTAIIPYTYANTNIRDRKPGDAVNLEGDVLGKYVERYLQARDAATTWPASQITLARLAEEGF